MSIQNSTVSKKMKKVLATGLPLIALSGFMSTALVIETAVADEVKVEKVADAAPAEGQVELITPEQKAELKAQLLAEGKTDAEADAEIEAMLANPKSEAPQ